LKTKRKIIASRWRLTRYDYFGQRRTEVVDNDGGQTCGHKWLQQIGKILEKTRRCKVDKRGETTRENITTVI
jgi:hypothetical protein